MPARKRGIDQITQNAKQIGLSLDKLTALKEVYSLFLIKNKRAGSGLGTQSTEGQEKRSTYIRDIEFYFDELIKKQSVINWEALLTRLVVYRIELYTENFIKRESTFGDALRATHVHLLQTLQFAYTKNSDCALLQIINEKTTKAPHVLEDLFDDISTLEEARKVNAAWGHHEALHNMFDQRFDYLFSFLNPEKIPREYPKALYTESNRVNTFVNELSLRCDDAHLGYGALFHQQPVAEEKEKQKNEFDGENPASKKKTSSRVNDKSHPWH